MPEFDKDALRFKIKEVRKSKGLSQAQVAKSASMTESALSQIEAGLRLPGLPSFYRLVTALGVTPNFMMGVDIESSKDLASKIQNLEEDDRIAVEQIVNSLLKLH